MNYLKEPDYLCEGNGIYVIESGFTGMTYVGSSYNVKNRLKQHQQALQNNRHCNYKLQKEFNLGHPLATNTAGYTTREEAFNAEQNILNDNSKYLLNISRNARYCSTVISIETRKKMSLSHIGKKASPETILKLIEIRKNTILSKEAKLKISLAVTNSNKIRICTNETRIKRSLGNLGKKRSSAFINNLRKINTGIKHTNETKQKISESRIKFPFTIDGVKYGHLTEASKVLNIPVGTISDRIKSKNFNNYTYC